MTNEIKNYITDGQDLGEKADELKKAGINDVTVVLNTLDHTRYKKLNDGKTLDLVFAGINEASDRQMNITLHVGLKEGVTDDEVLNFLQLTFQHKYDIVFLPTISYDFLKSKMPLLKKIEGDFAGVEMYKYPGSIGRIGFMMN